MMDGRCSLHICTGHNPFIWCWMWLMACALAGSHICRLHRSRIMMSITRAGHVPSPVAPNDNI